MKLRTAVLSLAVCLAAAASSFADDPHMGTWKLNEAKSTFAPGATKNTAVTYAAAADDAVKVTVDGVDKDGKTMHNEWVGKFDGKDYPVTGEPAYDSRAYKKVDARTMEMTIKKGGKVFSTGKIVVSADGKSRTVTTSAVDPGAKAMAITAVYDKQ